MELFDTYTQFLTVREEVIALAVKHSIYSENRDGKKVRPLAKIKTDKLLTQVNKLIAKWRVLADKLCEEDPVRYNRNSSTFSPEPTILYDRADIFIKESVAISTRIKTKDKILFQLRNIRRTEFNASGGMTDRVKELDKEIKFFVDDKEDQYRVRSTGYTSIVLLHRDKHTIECKKTNVTFAGVFFFDPDNSCQIHYPSQVDYERSDKIESMGITPIKCSLNLKGVLLRESDIVKAKQKTAEIRKKRLEAEAALKLETKRAGELAKIEAIKLATLQQAKQLGKKADRLKVKSKRLQQKASDVKPDIEAAKEAVNNASKLVEEKTNQLLASRISHVEQQLKPKPTKK